MLPGAQLGPLPPTTRTVPLENAWPLLAVIASSARARSLFPVPEAIQRKIERVETLKDGSALVVMGKEHEMGPGGMKAWLPSAASEKVASRLFRRVTSDGWSMETALGIALGIREAMYEKRGVGLSYQAEPLTVRSFSHPPISSLLPSSLFLFLLPTDTEADAVLPKDFGVCAGSLRVTSQDRIAYQRPSGQILPGDDPADHYFLYFTIASGESTFVDLNLFIFNFRLIVNPQFCASLPARSGARTDPFAQTLLPPSPPASSLPASPSAAARPSARSPTCTPSDQANPAALLRAGPARAIWRKRVRSRELVRRGARCWRRCIGC